MKRIAFAFVSLAAFFLATQSFASGRSAPYFSGASYQGGMFVNWTSRSLQEARDSVYDQMYRAGQRVDREFSGYYWEDDYNSAEVDCRERRFSTQGYGSQVFDNAVNTIIGSRLSACTVEITSSSNPGNDDDYAPYFSGASYQGGQFLNWTMRTIAEARDIVYDEMYRAGQNVDREASGFYSTRDYNRAAVDCRERRLTVQGYGADVFEQAVNEIVRYNLSGCVVRID